MRFTFLLLLINIASSAFSFTENDKLTPPGNMPVEVKPTLHINKIYNINTVEESYQIDGYFEFSWVDERLKHDHNTNTKTIIYENDKARELIDNDIWFPSFEFINVQEAPVIQNISIVIEPNGKVIYEERFNGIFSSDLNYRKFPFDIQNFEISIESFSYDNRFLIFTNPCLYPDISEKKDFIDKWELRSLNKKVINASYDNFEVTNEQKPSFSRIIYTVEAQRMAGYFVWQVLFPLLIIILASFLVFWIKDFSTQIAIGFTLMLTVVAFNFYSASILPELPYNTFIETTIIIGYTFIFFGILAVVINHRINLKKGKEDENKLLINSRYLFPVLYFISMLLLYFKFYH